MRRIAPHLQALMLFLLPFSNARANTQAATCYASVTNGYSGGIAISVGGHGYGLAPGESVQVPIKGPTGIMVWSCVWNGASWDCSWLNPATACPNGSYTVIRSGGPPEELTVVTGAAGTCEMCATRMSQGGSTAWASKQYDSLPGKTMSQKGCAVTSAAMLLDYLGITTLPDNQPLDPGSLNAYLAASKDGFSNHNIFWNGVAVRGLLGASQAQFYYDTQAVDEQLAAGNPVIMDVGGHFVLAIGKVFQNGHNTYKILDPGYSDRHYLDDPSYGNNFNKAVVFTSGGGPVPFATTAGGTAGLWVDAMSASVDVVDPLGRHSASGVGTQIPGAVSAIEPGLFDDAGPDSLAGLGPARSTVWIPTPLGGDYALLLHGGSGAAATITAYAYDGAGALIVDRHIDVALDGAGFASTTVTLPSGPAGVGDDERLAFMLSASPNPVRTSARITFTLPEAMPVRVSVYDVRGRRIAILAEGRFDAGRHDAVWGGDGRAALEPGLYFVEVRARARKVVKLVVAK